MNDTTKTSDPQLEGSLRTSLQTSMAGLHVADPAVDDARSVLRRAQATRRRRRHRERALVGIAVVVLIIGSVIGLARVRDDGTRTVGAGAPAPGREGSSGTASVGTVAPPPTTLVPVDPVAPTGTRAPARGGGTIVPPLTVAPGPPPVPVTASSDGVPHLLLPGWTTVRFSTIEESAGRSAGPPYVEYEFRKGDQRLQLSFYAESEYGARIDHLIEPVPVRGANGQLLDYGNGRYRVDFIEGNRTWEADGGPFASPQAIVDVLERIEGADPQEWKASLPADAVTADTRFETVDQILVQVPIPPGFDVDALRTKDQPNSWYDLAASVLGHVECAWIERWLDAPPDTTQRPQAVAALAGVRAWPALEKMRSDGDYPAVMEQLAQSAVRGDRAGLAGYQAALGC